MTLPISTTTIGALLTAFKTQLVNQDVFNATTVFIGNTPDENLLPASTSYCIITPADLQILDEEIATVSADILLTVKNYLALDQDVRADQQDTSESGVFALVNSIAYALNLLMLPSADGFSYIVVEPVRIKDIDQSNQEDNWATVTIRFNAKFGWSYPDDYSYGHLPIETSTIGDILTAIKTQLIAQDVFNATTVFVGNNPDKNTVPPSTSYCILTPGSQEIIDEEITTISSDVFLTVWNYLALDQDIRSDEQDTSDSGVYAIADNIAGALNLFMLPSSDNTSYLVVEPIRIKSVKRVEQEDENSWVKLVIHFNCKYGWDYAPVISGQFDSAFSNAFDIG